MKVLYINGRFSQSTTKPDFLKSMGYNVQTFHLSENPIENYNSLYEICSSIGDCIVMGTSLGAFWASIMSYKFDLPCVIVNPCFDPIKMINDQVNLDILPLSCPVSTAYMDYRFKQTSQHRVAILANEDELFSNYWDDFENVWGGMVIRAHGNHSFSCPSCLNEINNALDIVKRNTTWI